MPPTYPPASCPGKAAAHPGPPPELRGSESQALPHPNPPLALGFEGAESANHSPAGWPTPGLVRSGWAVAGRRQGLCVSPFIESGSPWSGPGKGEEREVGVWRHLGGSKSVGGPRREQAFQAPAAVVHQDLGKSRICQMKDCGRPGGRLGGFQRMWHGLWGCALASDLVVASPTDLT